MGATTARIWSGNHRQKGVENLMVDHLSRLPDDDQRRDKEDIKEEFSDYQLLLMTTIVTLWYANIVNYLVSG